MKKLLLILFLFFTPLVNAQQITEYFTAKEGYNSAYDEASTVLTEPKLFFIGSMFMYNQIFGQLKYDLTTGKANFWIYGFIDGQDTTKKVVVGTIKMFVYLSQIFSPNEIDPEDFPYVSEHYFDNLEWFDSDSANIYFKTCQPYLDFANSGEEPETFNLGLFYNSDFDELPLNIPMWSAYIQLSGNRGFISPAVDIESRQTFCNYLITSNQDKKFAFDGINIVRNGDYLILSSDDILDNIEINVFSLDGKSVFSKSVFTNGQQENVYVPFSSFINGMYIVIAKSNKQIGVTKINLSN